MLSKTDYPAVRCPRKIHNSKYGLYSTVCRLKLYAKDPYTRWNVLMNVVWNFPQTILESMVMHAVTGVTYMNTVFGAANTLDFLQFFEEAYNSLNPVTLRPCLEVGDMIVMNKTISDKTMRLFFSFSHVEWYHPHLATSENLSRNATNQPW